MWTLTAQGGWASLGPSVSAQVPLHPALWRWQQIRRGGWARPVAWVSPFKGKGDQRELQKRSVTLGTHWPCHSPIPLAGLWRKQQLIH